MAHENWITGITTGTKHVWKIFLWTRFNAFVITSWGCRRRPQYAKSVILQELSHVLWWHSIFKGMYGYKVETVANVTYPDEEVNEKEYIEGQIHLLSGTVCPRSAGLHRLPIGINRIRIQTGQSIRHQFIKDMYIQSLWSEHPLPPLFKHS